MCQNKIETACPIIQMLLDESGKSATLQQQLMDLKANLTKAQTTIKTSDMKLKKNFNHKMNMKKCVKTR